MWNVFQFFLQITNLKNEIYVKSSSRHTWRLRAQGTGSMGFSLFPVFLASSPALLITNIQYIRLNIQFWTHTDDIVILKRKRHLSREQVSESRKRIRTTLGEVNSKVDSIFFLKLQNVEFLFEIDNIKHYMWNWQLDVSSIFGQCSLRKVHQS